MLDASIGAVYRSTPEARANLLFAADLLKLTGGSTLHVFVLQHGYRAYLASGTARRGALRQEGNVADACARITGLAPAAIKMHDGDHSFDAMRVPAGTLVVDDQLPLVRPDLHTLASWREESLLGRGGKTILVPFGDGEAGVRAALYVRALAAHLKLGFVFYHTTWRDPRIASDKPCDHMIGRAKTIATRLETLAADAGVPFQTVIEMAEDVVEGSLQAAMRYEACLIADARGPNTLMGSYVDQMLAQSPVPVLVAASPKTEVKP